MDYYFFDGRSVTLIVNDCEEYRQLVDGRYDNGLKLLTHHNINRRYVIIRDGDADDARRQLQEVANTLSF